MLSKLSTVAFNGIDTQEISVEVQISAGLPNFIIVGLPDKSIAESKERIRASFSHIGLSLPPRRIIVNLAPADLQKEGAHYDLPIALGILSALEIFDKAQLQDYIILGGLSLDALIAPVTGILPAAIFASSTQRGLICPTGNKNEASWAGENLSVIAAPNLLSLVSHFKGESLLNTNSPTRITPQTTTKELYGDISDIKGQSLLKRVFEIAAVGQHNVLMVGPPGAGKSMIAQRIMSIMPLPSAQEAVEITMIYSIAGMLPESGLIATRPFRAPHHSASLVSLVGGGIRAKPGEISLAHHGVLFLDELPEFSRATLEALRQPLETNAITIARANQHITYPAKIQLIAAMNPCRCGYFGVLQKECQRTPKCAADYQARISGPLLDRFDIVIYVPQVPIEDLFCKNEAKTNETSEFIHKRVLSALEFKQSKDRVLEMMETLQQDAKDRFKSFADKMEISARGCSKFLKVARTIADLAHSPIIHREHIEEAIQYRYMLIDARKM